MVRLIIIYSAIKNGFSLPCWKSQETPVLGSLCPPPRNPHICISFKKRSKARLVPSQKWTTYYWFSSVQFSRSVVSICDPMNCSTPGLPVHHKLPEFTQTHVLRVGDAIQPSHPLSSPSPPAPNPSQHQGLFQWVNSSHQVAKVLEFQPQHQSFQWTPRTDLL